VRDKREQIATLFLLAVRYPLYTSHRSPTPWRRRLRAARGNERATNTFERALKLDYYYPAELNLAQLNTRRGELDAARTPRRTLQQARRADLGVRCAAWRRIERKARRLRSSTSYATTAQALSRSKEYRTLRRKCRVSDTPDFRPRRRSRPDARSRGCAPSASLGRRRRPALKYGARQIEELEAEEFDRLPRATFVRGMVRGYASCSKSTPSHPRLARPVLRSGEVSLDLRAKRVLSPGRPSAAPTASTCSSRRGVVVVAGLLYGGRWAPFPGRATSHRTRRRLSPTAKPRPAPARKPPPQAAVPVAPALLRRRRNGGGRGLPPRRLSPAARRRNAPGRGREGKIRMEFAGESWVEIKDRDGRC